MRYEEPAIYNNFQPPQPTLADRKTSILSKNSQAKKDNIAPPQVGTQPSDGLLNLLGSSTISTGAGLADLVTTGAANALEYGAGAIGQQQLYTPQDTEVASNYFDQFTGENADRIANYDRSAYSGTQQDVGDNVGLAHKSVQQGNYGEALGQAGDAIATGLTIAPELVTESLPFIATLMVGGSVNAVRSAGTAAYKGALEVGGTKTMAKAASKAAEAEAKASLSLTKKLANTALENTGLLAMSAENTNQQNEEFKKNNNGEGMSTLQLARATAVNVAVNALDRGVFTDVVKLGGTGSLKSIVSTLPEATVKMLGKKVLGIAADMGKEGGQEYIQQWGQILNENLGTTGKKNLSDVFTDESNVDALTAGALGSSAGGLMSAPKTAIETAGALKRAGTIRKDFKVPTDAIKAGYDTADDQAKHAEYLDKGIKNNTATVADITKAEESIANIVKNKDLNPLVKLDQIQKTMPDSINGDTASVGIIKNFGRDEVNSVLSEFSKSVKALSSKKATNTFNELVKKVQGAKNISEKMAIIDEGITTLSIDDPSVSTKFEEAITSMKDGALKVVNDHGNNVAFNKAKVKLDYDIKKATNTKKAVEDRPAPELSTSTTYEEISQLKAKDLDAKLSTYSNETLKTIRKEAVAATRLARKTSNQEANFNGTGILKKIDLLFRGNTDVSTGKNVSDSINAIEATRKKTKATYNPKLSFKEKFDAFIKPFKDKYKDVQDKKTSKTGTYTEDVHATKKTVASAIHNINKTDESTKETINPADLPMMEEAVKHLKDMGEYTSARYDSIIKAFKDYKAKHKVDTKEEVHSAVTNGVSAIDRAARASFNENKDMFRKELGNELDKLIDRLVKQKLSKTEQALLASTLGKLGKTNEASKGYFNGKLDTLLKRNEDTDRDFKDTVKKAFTDGFNGVKESVSPEGREKAEQSVKATAEKVGKTEFAKDSASLYEKVLKGFTSNKNKARVEKVKRGIKKRYDKVKVDPIKSLDESYTDLKESIQTLFEDEVEISQETEDTILTTRDGKQIRMKEDEGCK